MTAKYLRQYRNKKGNLVFVFIVMGTPAELAKYKEIQGDFYREDEGNQPLFFDKDYTSEKIDLLITKDGKRVLADNSELEKAKSQVKAFGGDIGQAMAQVKAQQITGILVAPVAPDTPTE